MNMICSASIHARTGRLSDATAMENLSLTAFPRSNSFPFSNVHAAAADITCLQCSTFHMCAVFGLDALHVSGFLFLSTFGLVRRSDSCLSLSLSLSLSFGERAAAI